MTDAPTPPQAFPPAPKYDEKQNEKEEEKSQEKGEEKWRRDPLGSVIWAGILIWAGLVLLADNLGWLLGIRKALAGLPNFNEANLGAWSFILIGAGVLFLIEALIRMAVPAYRRPVTGTVIFGALLIAGGLGGAMNWTLLGPIFLITIGLILLLQSLLRKA
jgi:LiaF transmembrane domain